MALIHLKYIRKLNLEAFSLVAMANSVCYNTPDHSLTMTDTDFVRIIKTHKQSDNLLTKLQKLHTVCVDFSTGNFQSYMEEHETFFDGTGEAFDPFEELIHCFDVGCVDDLPTTIEQYTELVDLSRKYARLQAVQRLGFNQLLFGHMNVYREVINQQRESVMVPESELPADLLNTSAINEQIGHIEVEYALDGYNQFYQHATGLLSAYMGGDVEACALSILSLIAT